MELWEPRSNGEIFFRVNYIYDHSSRKPWLTLLAVHKRVTHQFFQIILITTSHFKQPVILNYNCYIIIRMSAYI